MKIKIKNNVVTIIMIFIFLMQNCFYLVNTNAIHITGVFAYLDIWLTLFTLYFGYQWIKYSKTKTNYYFGVQVALFVILIFVSAFQQNILTGQSLILGIRPQRGFLMILLSYFVLRKMFAVGRINIEQLIGSLYKVGIISAVLFVIQRFTIDYFQFLNVTINE